VDGLRSAWPALVSAVRARSTILADAAASAVPTEAAPPWLTVAVGESNPFLVQLLEEQGRQVEEILARAVGAPVRLKVVVPNAGGGPEGRPERPTEAAARAERLRALRGRDPALDTAVDALDLEIVE
jgi:hypothetical protein